MIRTFALAISLPLLGGLASQAKAACPRTLVFWAWERPEDLRFLDGRCTAVAWFAGQVDIQAAALRFTPRQQELAISPAEPNVPVLRVDARGAAPSGEQNLGRRQDFVRELRRFVSSKNLAGGLQIDFDAPRSWRRFYAQLLADVRSAMPPEAPLTMTALASWCLGDPWIREASVTEAVPMLFRMGAEAPSIRRALAASSAFSIRACRGSVGISLDEPAPTDVVQSSRRVYVFAPRAWTPELVAQAYERAGMAAPSK
jgi:hypothetical protein